MTALTLEKTWLVTPNLYTTSVGYSPTDAANLLHGIVTALLAFPGPIWSVKRSSNSVSVLNSNTWTTPANVVWASPATPHSWIILHNNITGMDLFINCNAAIASSNNIQMLYSPTGAFDILTGTITVNPTATDSTIVLGTTVDNSTTEAWLNVNTSNTTFNSRYHVWQSVDGTAFYVVAYGNGVRIVNWFCSTALNTNTSWTRPIVFWKPADFTLTWAELSSSTGYWRTRFGSQMIGTPATPYGSSGGMYASTECNGTTPVAQLNTGIINDLSGSFGGSLLGLCWSQGTAGVLFRGRQGRLADMWIGSNIIAEGTVFPSLAVPSFVQVGHLVLPWDSTSLYLMN